MRYLDTNKNQFLGFKPLVGRDKDGLPIKTSLYLREVIEDIKIVDRNPRINWDMKVWFRMEDNLNCTVCLAGAVLGQRKGIKNYLHPEEAGGKGVWPPRIVHLNDLRCG